MRSGFCSLKKIKKIRNWELREIPEFGKIEQLKIQPAAQQNSNGNCEKHLVFSPFFFSSFGRKWPKKKRHWKNSEGEFCPSFLKTLDKFFF
jgi:hypothetical protein